MTLSPPLAGRAAALALVFALLFLANRAMPYLADDFCRLVGAGPLAALAEAAGEYGRWTGRLAVTAATYLLLGDARAPSPLFDALNALAFAGLVALVLRLARLVDPRADSGAGAEASGQGGWRSFNDTLFAALALWWLPWSVGEVALWLTGSVGYLWAVCLELLVVIGALEGWRRRWLVPLALLAGSLLEPVGLAVSLFLAVLCLYRRRTGRRMPVLVLAAHAAGLLSTLAAPGNFVRAAMLPPSDPWERLPAVLDLMGRLFPPGWIVPLLLLALPLLLVRPPVGEVRAALWAARRVLLLPVAALALILVHLALPAPAVVPRLAFPASVLLATLLAALFRRRPGGAERQVALGAALLVTASAALAAPDLGALWRIGTAWHEAALRQAGEDAAVPGLLLSGQPMRARGPAVFMALSADPAAGYNPCFARAYGLRSVRALP